jgi:hypothetical protein
MPRERGGGTFRVGSRAVGGGVVCDDGDGGTNSFAMGDVGVESCDSSDCRTDGGGSVGMGGGTATSAWADDLDIFDETDRRE